MNAARRRGDLHGDPVRQAAGDGTVSVRADLSIDLDGASATLTGDGDRLVLATERPGALWDALAGAALPIRAGSGSVGSVSGAAGVGRVAEVLREAGLNLDVRGPRGTVASLGAGVDSGLGRVLTGSSALRPGAPAAVAPLAWQAVQTRPAARVAGFALALGLVAVLGIVVVRRAPRSR